MLNRSPLNRMPLNRPFSTDVFAVISLNGDGGLSVKALAEFSGQASLRGNGDVRISSTREITVSGEWEGVGSFLAAFIRDRFNSTKLSGDARMRVFAGRYHVDEITIIGPIAPGDRIVLDSERLMMTINGANALHRMQGDFFDLIKGGNPILYSDPASARQVLVRITFKDKFV